MHEAVLFLHNLLGVQPNCRDSVGHLLYVALEELPAVAGITPEGFVALVPVEADDLANLLRRVAADGFVQVVRIEAELLGLRGPGRRFGLSVSRDSDGYGVAVGARLAGFRQAALAGDERGRRWPPFILNRLNRR